MEKEDDMGLDKACKNKKKTFLKVFLWSTYLDFARQTRGTGRVVQSVTFLAIDACLTADSGVASSIPARSHTFVEIDHKIISKVILLPSAE